MSICTLCPHHCGVDRAVSVGYCGAKEPMRVARVALHFWEEPCISGKRGSGTVFFTGCNLRCVFCQNHEISAFADAGKEITVSQLRSLFCRLIEQGAHNINLVTPSHYVLPICEALQAEKLPVPVIYNCGGYESPDALKRLEGLIDIYLPDYKYADSILAQKLSRAPDYPQVAVAAITQMLAQTGKPIYDADGMLQKGTIIRHLILPGHTKNSIAVLQSIAQHFGTEVPVSLMAQYTPHGEIDAFPELNRRITQRELEKVQDVLFMLSLDGYIQSRKSAKEAFIPDFDGTGL